MEQTIGFLTVATGDEHYYRIADNLRKSYRRFSPAPRPFAILCDRENDYTRNFDHVILLPNPTGSYLDKLQLFDYLPYDINIFIDADCLAYGDLNQLFSYFETADDVSCMGRILPLDDTTGWFNYEDLGDLKPRVSYCVGLHGGIYHIRKTPKAKAVFDTAKQLAKDYHQYNFKGNFSSPGDEPIIALSMALNGCRPVPHDIGKICCYWELINAMDLSMNQGLAWIRPQKKETILVHWGTRFTRGLLYRKQIAILDQLENDASALQISLANWKYNALIAAERIHHLLLRIFRKLKRILHLS